MSGTQIFKIGLWHHMTGRGYYVYGELEPLTRKYRIGTLDLRVWELG